MPAAYEWDGETIVLHRDLTELDVFLREFLEVLKKHLDYLVVSGFVSISSGRTRGTEDIDVLVEVKDESTFSRFFFDIVDHGFWCYQGDTPNDVWPYVLDLLSIRFAREDHMFPNIEFIPINRTKKAKYFEFSHPVRMKVQQFEFKIPPIEFEILFKELVLGGEKDIADARHLRTFFSDILDKSRFKEYERVIKGDKHV